MKQIHKAEGVVLHTLKFREQEEIVTLFSPHIGILKLITRVGNKSQPLSRFTIGEFVYYGGPGDLFRCKEISPLHHNLKLRERLASIEAAYALAKAIAATQVAGKPTPELYQLFCLYLQEIPHFEDPSLLSASFYLKLLRHEGLLTLEDAAFSSEELPIIQLLAYSRKLSDLRIATLPEKLKGKIEACFLERMG